MVNRIDMVEFNKFLDKGTAIKRSFSGATASNLNYYIEEVLNEENVDRIIINIGTNNLTKKKQTESETAMEIIDVVKKCNHYGINEIFVSGLTFRPSYQQKIEIINNLLEVNAEKYNYIFIDNSDITERHLWKDKLHLNNQGTINLCCNFLDCLNGKTNYNNFY